MKRGFAGIGMIHPSKSTNLGTLFRSALAFGADFIYTIGGKYKVQPTDTCSSLKHIPYYHYNCKEDFINNMPHGCRLVIVELANNAHSLPNFAHPEQACYLLGNEGGGLPKEWLEKYTVIQIPSDFCLNVAVSGSIVLYDRISKRGKL